VSLFPAGTFEEEFIALGANNESKTNLLFRTVFTCADGSGTFFAQRHVFSTHNEDGSSTNSGPISFHGGTGDYTGLVVMAMTEAPPQREWE
jgi:hypothetical protein